MIRYINCIRKKADISAEEFREYWNSTEYRELLDKVADHYQADRYSRNLALRVEMGERLINDRGLDEPYDGTIEFFWENANQLASLYDSDQAQALATQINKFQGEFIDLSRSTAFFTESETD